jgi:DNA-binding NarL/FixJ family response regulator
MSAWPRDPDAQPPRPVIAPAVPTRDAARATPARALRVVLGEDNLIAREGVEALLRGIGVEVVASCPDLPTLREAVERLRPDLVVTDIRLPPDETDEGLRLAHELRATQPDVGVVVLSQHAEPVYARALFAEGAERRGYLVKDRLRDITELERALHDVAAGGTALDQRIVQRLLTGWAVESATPLASLTAREHDVLALIATGRSNAAVADALGITRRAVERHVGAIFAKLGLSDRDDVSPRVQAALLFLADEQAHRGDGYDA